MRKTLAALALVLSLLITGCGGGLDADLKKPGDDVRKSAEGLSLTELESRINELEKRTNDLNKKVGSKDPSDDEMQVMTKYIEVGGIYATELLKRKVK